MIYYERYVVTDPSVVCWFVDYIKLKSLNLNVVLERWNGKWSIVLSSDDKNEIHGIMMFCAFDNRPYINYKCAAEWNSNHGELPFLATMPPV